MTILLDHITNIAYYQTSQQSKLHIQQIEQIFTKDFQTLKHIE